jgi:hypothetical protein
MTIHALHRRLLRLEQAARASDAVKVVIRPAGLDGDALAEWEQDNLVDYGLVVVLNKFSEPDAPPVAEPVQEQAPAMSDVLPVINP